MIMMTKLCILATFVFFLMGNIFSQEKDRESTSEKKEISSKAKVNWLTFEEALKLQENEPKKIMVDVYTDWCGWCKKMDAETFSHPVIARYLNKHYYSVKFNAEQKEEITAFGQTFKFVDNGRRGYHELAAALLNGKLSFPSVAYIDEELQLLGAVPGFQRPKDIEPLLSYIANGEYKAVDYEKYKTSFESQIE